MEEDRCNEILLRLERESDRRVLKKKLPTNLFDFSL